MVLKTFNVDKEVYDRFSKHCKSSGLSMSRLVNMFMKIHLKDAPQIKESYIKKIEKISKEGNFIHIGTAEDFRKKYLPDKN